MDRLRKLLKRDQSYEPLEGGSVEADGQAIGNSRIVPFSWLDYLIFTLLGIAMLWAW